MRSSITLIFVKIRPSPLFVLGQRHQLDAVLAGGQCQFTVFERQRVLAEDLASPA